MHLTYYWPFLRVILQENLLFSTLIPGSVFHFSDYVVFYGDNI